MKKSIVVLALSFLLGGCALPTSIQVASWAIDGISYLATKKSMTDHGLSLVREQDCALWRVVKQTDVCVNYEDAGTAVAAKDDENTPEPSTELSVQVASLDDGGILPAVRTTPQDDDPSMTDDETARLADFDTAAGTEHPTAKPNKPVTAVVAYQGHASGTFGAAWNDTLTRDRAAARAMTVTPATADLSVGLMPDTGKASVMPGYSADTFTAAWNFQNGTSRPTIQWWVMAASPTPQQDQYRIEDDTFVAEAAAESEVEESSENQDFRLEISYNTLSKNNKRTPSSDSVSSDSEADIETLAVETPMTSASIKPEPVAPAPLQNARADEKSVYFVIASYDDSASAAKVLSDHRALNVQLVVGRFDGREVYRGIVGPFALADMDRVKRKITKAGLKNAWAARLDHRRWTFVYAAGLPTKLAFRN